MCLCCWASASFAQNHTYTPGVYGEPPWDEIIIHKSNYQGRRFYYSTPGYNDIFRPDPYKDQFLLPEPDFYRSKKVAQVKITDFQHQLLFVLDIDPSGLPAKTTTFDGLTREEQFFYDQTGFNNVTVKRFIKEGHVIRVDTLKYARQKKVINDTAYDYLVLRTNVYKTGRFLNEQNNFYNQTYGGNTMENFPVFYVSTAPKKTNHKANRQKKFACNYLPDQLYFSREDVTVEEHRFTFRGTLFNPGEAALKMYAPECYPGIETRYADLPCEKFVEPTFMRQAMTCGSSLQHWYEYTQYPNSHYSYSQNSKGLKDTCYSDSGSGKALEYYFTYAYHE